MELKTSTSEVTVGLILLLAHFYEDFIPVASDTAAIPLLATGSYYWREGGDQTGVVGAVTPSIDMLVANGCRQLCAMSSTVQRSRLFFLTCVNSYKRQLVVGVACRRRLPLIFLPSFR